MPGQLISHSGAGSQYTSLRFTEHLALQGISPSIGSVGDAYDCELKGSLRRRSDPCYDRPCGCLRVDVSTVAAAAPGPLAGRP